RKGAADAAGVGQRVGVLHQGEHGVVGDVTLQPAGVDGQAGVGQVGRGTGGADTADAGGIEQVEHQFAAVGDGGGGDQFVGRDTQGARAGEIAHAHVLLGVEGAAGADVGVGQGQTR